MIVSKAAHAVLSQLAALSRDNAHGVFNKFVSDGSNHPSKQCSGIAFKIGRTARGLRVYVRTPSGVRKVSWRMDQSVVSEIIHYVYERNYKGKAC